MELVRKLRDNFDSPREVLLFGRVFLLITALPLLVKFLTLPGLMKFLSRGFPRAAGVGDAVVYRHKVVRFTDYLLSRNFWIYRKTCLKRSLALYHFLCPVVPGLGICFGIKAGKDGIRDKGRGLDGHSWLVRNGEIFLEEKPDLAKKYVVTFRFPENPSTSKTSGSDFADLSCENRLLLYCSRAGDRGKSASELNDLLARPLNWEFISKAARSSNIPQLLYYNLKGLSGGGLIPARVMQDFRTAYHDTLAKNMYLYSELRTILEAFRDAGLEPIALKGAALAGIVYPDMGLRQMADIDLLVRKDELSVADRVMTGLGYSQIRGFSSHRHEEHRFHLAPYRHAGKPVVVEIHWNISRCTGAADINKWWRRALRKDLLDYRILVPSPEDMLIHLSVHLFNHGYDNGYVLRCMCDVFETLRNYAASIDWALLQREIEGQGVEKKVHSVLYLSRKFFFPSDDLLIPISLDQADHRFLRVLESSLFLSPGNDPINPHILTSMMIGDYSERIRYLLSKVFLSRPQMSARYPGLPFSKMMFIYYLVRPLQLIMRYGKSALRIYTTERKADNGHRL